MAGRDDGHVPVAGRKCRFKTRILEHSRPGSGHNTAAFAFRIAKDEAVGRGTGTGKSGDDLHDGPEFVR